MAIFKITSENLQLLGIMELLILGQSLNSITYSCYAARGDAWFIGIPLFLIGYEIKKREKELMLYISSYIALALISVGSLMTLLEWRWIQGRQQMYVGFIIVAIGCILFSSHNPEKYTNKVIAFIGDKLSLYVYVLHISIGIFVEKFAKILRIDQNIWYQCLKPTVVIISTIVISAVVYYTKKKALSIEQKS